MQAGWKGGGGAGEAVAAGEAMRAGGLRARAHLHNDVQQGPRVDPVEIAVACHAVIHALGEREGVLSS